MSRRDLTIAALVGLAVLALVWWPIGAKPEVQIVDVKMPTLSQVAQRGHTVFKANCAGCHGENAGGSEQGPPLIHIIYEPNHHSDASFYAAVASGVRQHHWSFGNMPPVEGIAPEEVGEIISFVRTVQRANGIN